MAHTTKDKQKLLARVHRIKGQIEAVERALNNGYDCSDVLHRIAAARGAMNSLMNELLEGHIRFHVLDPKQKPGSQRAIAADELIDIVKTYLR
jgi:DNA-binding FrmR family transcriptional regulator